MLAIDREKIRTLEFGVGLSTQGSTPFTLIPAGRNVQETLEKMVQRTLDALDRQIASKARFDVADKHAGTEYLYVDLDDVMAEPLRALHLSENLDIDSRVLATLADVSSYFARLTDTDGRRLTAVRRANQFKAVQSQRTMVFGDDALEMVDKPLFQLNDDFDVLIDEETVHILHPAGFRALSQVDEAVRSGVRRNLADIATSIPYVEWGPVQEYAETHPRAASLLSSIRTNRFAEHIDSSLLLALCKDTRVGASLVDGSVVVADKDILGFLEVLDRRRYEIDLVKAAPEQFRAASRRQLSAQRN